MPARKLFWSRTLLIFLIMLCVGASTAINVAAGPRTGPAMGVRAAAPLCFAIASLVIEVFPHRMSRITWVGVGGVAVIALGISWHHGFEFGIDQGEHPLSAAAYPLCIDLLVMVLFDRLKNLGVGPEPKVKRRAAPKRAKAAAAPAPPEPASEPKAIEAAAANAEVDDRQARVLAHLNEHGTDFSLNKLSQHLNISRRTLGRDLEALGVELGSPATNGSNHS